ncbi:hypothetical protein OAK10_02285 [Candidatus Pelagibacter sp.]|nr:hypothetical protein [Candidatus Pelagibacter sp.]
MKKVLIIFGLMLFLTNFAYSNETKCTDFKKFSKEYLKCNADKIKKVTIKKAKEIQEGTAKKTENFKESVKNLTNKAKNKIKKKE